MGDRMRRREPYLARRILDALLREDYGDLAKRVTRSKEGVALLLADGRRVRLAPGLLFQDFVVADDELLGLEQVLNTLQEIADPADAEGVAAFFDECVEALHALELHDEHRPRITGRRLADYEALAAFVDHPVYPTARARAGLSDEELLAYAPEFAPSFELRWAWVPRSDVTGAATQWGPQEGGAVLMPVHPLSVGALPPRARLAHGGPRITVRPTLSMRTVQLDDRTQLKLPLPTSTLGRRNRRSIKPSTLADGASAERLLRALADPGILLADEQTYAHAGHEYLGWMLRRLPEGRIIPVAALNVPEVREELGDVEDLLTRYLTTLLRWNVRLFVRYGVALEAHQQNLALVIDGGADLKLLVKDNDGLLVSPARLAAAGVTPPSFTDERMLTDDPHALADVFVTITLHLAAASIAFGALPADRAAMLVRGCLEEALAEHGDDPMARLLRARTLDAVRLTGKSMITAGTLVAKERSGARDVNKFYGTSGPNYLRALSLTGNLLVGLPPHRRAGSGP
ncbi:IucA/IucC family protein [Nonomuraea sp. NPDC003804]|uniref:IucA/IucC family protein n=1 Tax=Nonomuraea sp. NPDC003804 TaxID=3154547 RepID=UPI0033B3B9CF